MTTAAEMPRRVLHATHALLEAAAAHRMPVRAREIVIYDTEALDAAQTSRALQQAPALGLAACAGPYWIPTARAHELRAALENSYLADDHGSEG